MAGGGELRWVAADLTLIVEEARRRLDLSPIAAAVLGDSLAGAALLLHLAAPTTTRLVVEIHGRGPLRRVLAEADHEGNLRGMVGQPHVDLPPTAAGRLAIADAVGRGFLRVWRERPDARPYESVVQIVSGHLGQDLAHFLAQSEQTRSAVLLGVLAKPAGIAAAGGMIVEVLPGASPETVERLERNVAGIHEVSRLLEERGVPALADRLFGGLDWEVRESFPLRYQCRCRRERLQELLALLPAEDRQQLALDEGTVESECVFCGAVYRFAPQELVAPS